MSRQWNLDRVMRFIMTAVAVVAVLALVYYLRGVLFPFFAAFLLAYLRRSSRIVLMSLCISATCCLNCSALTALRRWRGLIDSQS